MVNRVQDPRLNLLVPAPGEPSEGTRTLRSQPGASRGESAHSDDLDQERNAGRREPGGFVPQERVEPVRPRVRPNGQGEVSDDLGQGWEHPRKRPVRQAPTDRQARRQSNDRHRGRSTRAPRSVGRPTQAGLPPSGRRRSNEVAGRRIPRRGLHEGRDSRGNRQARSEE